MQHWLVTLVHWINTTTLSQRLQDILWVVPLLQTIHILVIGALFSSVVMIVLRLLFLVGCDQPLAAVSARYLRVIWWSLPILLLTGSTLVIIEPARDLRSPAFQLKMLLILVVVVAMFVYQRALVRNSTRWDVPRRRLAAGVMGTVGLLIWIGIIFAGRWIAYLPGRD